MDENGLVALQTAHDDDKLPGGEIIDGDRRCVQRGHPRRALEDLTQRDADCVRIAAEARQREHIASDPARIDARADGIDTATDLVARHDRDRRQIWIETEAAENIGEIYSARLDANTHFAGFGFGIGRVPDLENFGRAGFCDPNLPHGLRLPFRAEARNHRIKQAKSYRTSVASALLHLTPVHADDSAVPRRHCD